MQIHGERFETTIVVDGKTIEYACAPLGERSGRGLFRLNADRTEWTQVRGLADTPVFYAASEFARWVEREMNDEIPSLTPLPFDTEVRTDAKGYAVNVECDRKHDGFRGMALQVRGVWECQGGCGRSMVTADVLEKQREQRASR